MLERNITLYCPVCGNDQFSCLDDNYENLADAPDFIRFQCADCKKIVTKAELLESNKAVINANIEDIKQEMLKKIEKQIKKIFK